jgi:7,8-dihydro-6-hydroxymethylpterin dimethyltransferase
VAFTGRIALAEREAKRFTQADVAIQVSEQTGYTDSYEDYFPVGCVSPFSMLISALKGEQTTHITCHPHCSLGTYLFVDQASGTAIPITRFVDVGAMLQEIYKIAHKAEQASFQLWNKIKVWNSLQKHFHEQYAPPGLTFQKFLQTLQGMTDKKYGRDGQDGTYTYRTVLVAAMHFMDSYNYDIERVKRCVIHYAAPNGLIYPFCAYNSGPVFRDKIEKKYSISLEQQLENPELLQIQSAKS